MSVIVKNMEMPNTCEECQESCEIGSNLFCLVVNDENKWGWKKSENGFESRPVWCPLRPLPKRHGRLIDADNFSAVMKERQLASAKWLREAKDAETINRADAVFAVLCEVKLTIGKLPTIVEAEGE